MMANKKKILSAGLLVNRLAYYMSDEVMNKPEVKADLAELEVILSNFSDYLEELKKMKIDTDGMMEGSVMLMKAQAFNDALDRAIQKFPME